MANLTNYHSHCSFCDGRMPMEDFVRAAAKAGFSSYGISSHAPLPYSTSWTMEKKDLPAYLTEIKRLKKLFAPQLEVYAGLEIDYLDEMHNPASPLFTELPLDYRIGSVHILYDQDGHPVEIDCSKETFQARLIEQFDNDLEEVVRAYYRTQLRMLELGHIDILGHCDKLDSRADFCHPGILQETWYRKIMGNFLDTVADSGIMVEINTKKYKEDGHFFPDESLFHELKRRNIPVVVNSDAHYADRINASRPEALAALIKAGYRTVREMHHGEWMDSRIE